ncbi:MAG: NAD(P)-dependent alcohol dehydrogenase [Hyphomicrobiales bacterium]|nr:MAG: NAD(P)-dependent alcohol dehydrogenase [Hyphomicrobiales bacterium]
MTTTTAAVLRSHDTPFTLEKVELGPLLPDELLVRIVGAGMCHTDLAIRDPLYSQTLPAILGHEGAGIVEAVGPSVTSAVPGDHVLISFEYCGHCDSCLHGRPAYCAEFWVRNGGRRVDGTTAAESTSGEPLANRFFGQSSFAEHCIATDRNIVVVDKDVPLELFGPLGCGFQTGAGTVLNEMKLRAGQTIVIFGAGAVGLSAVMAAVIAGASEIVVVDLNQDRLDIACDLGATRVVHGATEDLASAVTAGGAGFDFSFDTTGIAKVMLAAVQTLATGGACVLVGAAQELCVSPMALAGRTVTYVLEGGSVPRSFIPRLIDYWRQGRFPIEKLTRTYPLSEINQAEADSHSGVTIKPILVP